MFQAMANLASLPFPVAVCIETDRAGYLRTVGSVREAAEVLTSSWPHDKRGPNFKMAAEACVDALAGNGRADAAAVQWAFKLAAREAGIFVREGRCW